MAMKTYNNNDRQPMNITYSNISFSNPESSIAPTRFSISYFNKVMKISIALRNNASSNDSYATYDTDNAVSVYVSNTKAYILRQMIEKLKSDDSIHNVCIDLKNGLFKVSDGKEYGTNNYCFAILYADEVGNISEAVYECKDINKGIYNYNDGKYSTESFPLMELETFSMVLDEYFKASSYAIASTIMEASMYKRDYLSDVIKQIAEKVGVQTKKGNSFSNNSSFLQRNSSNTSVTNNVGYETTDFDSIANGLD